MITPKPTDSEKKICEAAASHVLKLPSASKFGFHMYPRPLSTFCSGTVGSGVPSVRTRMSTISAHTAMIGMANDTNFSMPLDRPRNTKKMFTAKTTAQLITVNRESPVNSVPSPADPVIAA